MQIYLYIDRSNIHIDKAKVDIPFVKIENIYLEQQKLMRSVPELGYDLHKGVTSLQPQVSHGKTCMYHRWVGSPMSEALNS